MKCDEVQPLCGTYLDSELDTRTSLEIQQHLKACPACARLFDEEEKLEGRLRAGLNRGARTAALWERIERSVAAATSAPARPGPSPRLSPPAGWNVLLQALSEQLPTGWGRARWAWAGVGMAWVVILALNFAAREPEAALAAGKQLPPAAEVRFAGKQRQLMMADLAAPAEPAPGDKPKPLLPSPRSDRRTETLNT